MGVSGTRRGTQQRAPHPRQVKSMNIVHFINSILAFTFTSSCFQIYSLSATISPLHLENKKARRRLPAGLVFLDVLHYTFSAS
jgi:hypothetical protein